MYLQSKPGPLQRSYELLTDYEVNPCRKVFILNVGMLIWQQNNPSLGVYVSVCRIVRNAAEMLLVCRVACLMKFKIWFKHRTSKTFLLAYISGRKFWRNQLYFTSFLHKLTINVSTGNCCWIFTVTLFVVVAAAVIHSALGFSTISGEPWPWCILTNYSWGHGYVLLWNNG